MSRSIPVTAGTPSNDLTSFSSRIAPPFTGTGRSVGHRFGEAGEVRGEATAIVRVVLDRQQPLLHLPPWREKYTAIVLHEPMQMAQSGVDFQEIAELSDPVPAERHAALGTGGYHMPAEAVLGDRRLQGGAQSGAERIKPGIGLQGEHVGEGGAGGGHRERVAVERADLL